MGRAKEWLRVGGETLLGRTVRVLGEVAEVVVVAGRAGQVLPELPAGVEVVFDEFAGAGPVAGIEAGLRRLRGRCDVAVVAACDHPGLKVEVVRLLAKTLADERSVACTDPPVSPLGKGGRKRNPPVSLLCEGGESAVAVIVEHLGRLNPLLGVYPTELADRARGFLLRGERAAGRFADECQARVISSEAFREVDAELTSLVNVNDAAEYERVTKPGNHGATEGSAPKC